MRTPALRSIARLSLPLAVLVAGAAAGAQEPRFTARVDIVRVDALVTRRGQPVAGLTKDDFEVFDNGVPQHVDLVSFGQLPINAIMALDLSQSVAGQTLEHLRTAGHALLAALKARDQAALVGFSHAVTVESALTPNLAAVGAALDRATPSGATSLADACFSSILLGESDQGRALVLAFSDGVDTSSWLTTDDVLDTARRADVVVYAFTPAESPRTGLLDDLASTTGGSVAQIGSTKELSAQFVRVLAEFRQRYVMSYSPAGVPADGWHRLEVRVKPAGLKIQARPGYLAGH